MTSSQLRPGLADSEHSRQPDELPGIAAPGYIGSAELFAKPVALPRLPLPRGATGKAELKCRLAIFDMDGTLVDSFPWFLSVVNSVADRHGFRRIEHHEIDRLRDKGSREILSHLRVPLWKLPAIARDMRKLKSESLHRIPLFPGVPQMLQNLVERGTELAVVSSDSEANVRAALAAEA